MNYMLKNTNFFINQPNPEVYGGNKKKLQNKTLGDQKKFKVLFFLLLKKLQYFLGISFLYPCPYLTS